MNILDQIGNTPLIKLTKVVESPFVEIFVKCEFLNPGGSIKDRMALCMIEQAEKYGILKPGGTIVDQSTGNTGPALAFVGAVKGYKVQIFLPAELSSSYDPSDRIRIARLFGCSVTSVHLEDHNSNFVDLDPTEKAAWFVALRMKECYEFEQDEPNTWWSNQLCNPDNTKAHREQTGVEILQQMKGNVDAWVASIGTGGTLLGVAQSLKQHNPGAHVVGVVPGDDPRIKWVRSKSIHHTLENLRVPPQRFIIEDILENKILDQELEVSNEDAKVMADRLCREEGLFCGISSGANVFAAIQLARKMKRGSRIVTVLVDRRDRYFAEYPNEHYVV